MLPLTARLKVGLVLIVTLSQLVTAGGAEAGDRDIKMIVPDPELCTVSPYTVSELRDHLVSISAPQQYERRPRLESIPVTYQSDDWQTNEQVGRFLLMMTACENKGVLYSSRLFTNNKLLLRIPISSLDEFDGWASQFEGDNEPTESYGSELVIGGVFGTRVLDDGRIGTFFIAGDAPTISPLLNVYLSAAYVVLVPLGDSFLVDEDFGVGDVRAPDDEVCCE